MPKAESCTRPYSPPALESVLRVACMMHNLSTASQGPRAARRAAGIRAPRRVCNDRQRSPLALPWAGVNARRILFGFDQVALLGIVDSSIDGPLLRDGLLKLDLRSVSASTIEKKMPKSKRERTGAHRCLNLSCLRLYLLLQRIRCCAGRSFTNKD